MKRRVFLMIAVSFVAFPVFSQVIHVPDDHPTIQEAINMAVDGDTVLVAEGSYIENINYRGKAITVASQFILDSDTSHISRTIIDGSDPFYPDSGSTVNMLLARDTTSVLCGFTIQGGTGTGPFEHLLGGTTERLGGGIIMAGGKIVNNKIKNNQIHYNQIAAGGGIEAGRVDIIGPDAAVNLVIRNNLIFHNSIHSETDYTGGGGLGVELSNHYTLVENNEIYENTSTTDAIYKAMGGGMQLGRYTSSNGVAIIRDNFIHHNEIHSEFSFGGGMFYLLFYDDPVNNFQPTEIYNNVIANNHSDSHAGGACFWYLFIWIDKPPVDPVLTNNTFVNNYADVGSGIGNVNADIVLVNNILWDDFPEEGGPEFFNGDLSYCPPSPAWCKGNEAIIRTAYNTIRGGWTGEGNIAYDPYFEEGTFQLSDSSSCVGRGVDSVQINDVWYFAPTLDFEGDSRPNAVDSFVDMGAFESEFNRVLLSDANLLDLNLQEYEFNPMFHLDSLSYSIVVIDTFTSVNNIMAIPMDFLADVDINHATDILSEDVDDRTTIITVTSSDGSAEKIYRVEFIALSTDAGLSELSVENLILIPEFDADITEYLVQIPDSITAVPKVFGVANEKNAEVKIYDATFADEDHMTTNIIVTPEAGRTFNNLYKIVFDYEVGVPEWSGNMGLKIFPNPTSGAIAVQTKISTGAEIEITSLNGQLVYSGEMEGSSFQIDLSSFQKGVYFITISSKDYVTTRKIVKL